MGLVLSFRVFRSVLSRTISSTQHYSYMQTVGDPQVFKCPPIPNRNPDYMPLHYTYYIIIHSYAIHNIFTEA